METEELEGKINNMKVSVNNKSQTLPFNADDNLMFPLFACISPNILTIVVLMLLKIFLRNIKKC